MGRGSRSAGSLRDRITAVADATRATFGLPAGLAMAAGVVAGFGTPALDDWLGVSMPLFEFSTQDAARGLLETIATTTVSVAGLAFSVTVVAFTLSSNQLSPRVLRSFRRDRLSQLTLAALLGSFIYCLTALVRLGTLDQGRVPDLTITVAVLLALLSFGLFAGFIGHITRMLQPSSVIASIDADAAGEQERPYPAGAGGEPEREQEARAALDRTLAAAPPRPARCDGHGFLTALRTDELIELACELDGVVLQRARIGEYVLPGDVVAEVSATDPAAAAELAERAPAAFELGPQRTLPGDPGYPVRQLADVAIKALSPSINDPTTARNALDALTAGLIRFAAAEPAAAVRLDGAGAPRLLAAAPDLDDLVELGFGEVERFAADQPAVLGRCHELLGRVAAAADRHGHSRAAADRLRRSIARRLDALRSEAAG
ncbi:MAG: DUF2254 domain-containing protein [Solirubrobacterales bacterium]|nr:DUF2254 domain-containing protein [Solirubrobacterales bacterium]